MRDAHKALFPGLRIGYAVVPQALLSAFANARYLMDRQPPTLYQTVVAEFLRQGYFAAHIRRMRHIYRDQRDAVAETLTSRVAEYLAVVVPEQGMHLVAYFKAKVSDVQVEPRRADRNHRSCHQPLLPGGTSSLGFDVGVQRLSAATDHTGGVALGGVCRQPEGH
jgi:DNA-binding transcriptional MocR family regulator